MFIFLNLPIYQYPHTLLSQVLSMSRLGGAGAVAQLVADIPLPAVEVTWERNFLVVANNLAKTQLMLHVFMLTLAFLNGKQFSIFHHWRKFMRSYIFLIPRP